MIVPFSFSYKNMELFGPCLCSAIDKSVVNILNDNRVVHWQYFLSFCFFQTDPLVQGSPIPGERIGIGPWPIGNWGAQAVANLPKLHLHKQ